MQSKAQKLKKKREEKKLARDSVPDDERNKRANNLPKPVAPGSFWTKALTANAAWTPDTFPEFPDALFWIRQGTALLCGFAWGFAGIEGLLSIPVFLLLALFFGNMYIKFAGVDESSFGDPTLLAMEGLGSAFGVFIVAWIMTYTFFHKYDLGPVPVEIIEDPVSSTLNAAFNAGNDEGLSASSNDDVASALNGGLDSDSYKTAEAAVSPDGSSEAGSLFVDQEEDDFS
jgi:hypothetical protein